VKVQDEDGKLVEKQFYFTVEPEPCEMESKLEEEWIEPFRGQKTTLYKSAPELKCVAGKVPGKKTLEGAYLSDHGYPIIGMLHESVPHSEDAHKCHEDNTGEPGRLAKTEDGVRYNPACEFKPWCEKRAKEGYKSGMGLIFRKVAEIGEYKAACAAGEGPQQEESQDSAEKPDPKDSGEPGVVACVTLGKVPCKAAVGACEWKDKKCKSVQAEEEPEGDAWKGFDKTFKSYQKICSTPKLCKSCGGKLKKKTKCTMKEKKIKCAKLKDKAICAVVPGCAEKKGKCKGKAKFEK